MSKLLIFIFIISILFISCDGRHRNYQTNEEVLKEHKLFDSFSEHIKYIPESYSEVTTDTIMSNGFQVKIASYTDMNNNYLNEFTKNSIKFKNYYRSIKSVVTITKNKKEIVSKLITKDTFINYNTIYTNELKNKMIHDIWLNEYESLINNKVILNVLFQIPGTKDYKSYLISFNENGSFEIINDIKQQYT